MKKVIKKAKTKAERRVEILKDVLLQLKTERFLAQKGSYVNLSYTLETLRDDDGNKDAKTCLLQDKGNCKVCAKGAIFLSLVRKENKVKMFELEDDDVREKRTNALFGEANMNLMEAAFERWPYEIGGSYMENNWINSDECKYHEEIEDFYDKYTISHHRLEAIVKNAIKNGGIFKLKKK